MHRRRATPVRSVLELLLVAACPPVAGGASTYSSGGSNTAQLEPFRVASIPDILDNLDQYDKFWIEPSSPASGSASGSGGGGGAGCVWSECALDDTDDAYMGDNRDGDEQWYQYRTQSFCANAAYSLYGRKKEASNPFQGGWAGCSQRHFLNSFFTYGGADNLLKAAGVTPVSYYNSGGDDDDGNDDGGGGDDDDDGYASNANCVEVDYEEEDDDDQAAGDDGQDGRRLSSNDNNNDGYSSGLGCSSGGDYIIAVFQGGSCDGNYFVDALDTFDEYNRQHASMGCHKLWDAHHSASTDVVYKLLSNSWSCDVRLYPQGCPDPYGAKQRYDDALRTAAHGGNPLRAYQSLIWTTRLQAVIPALLAMTAAVLALTCWMKVRTRAESKTRGGMAAPGCLECLWEDARATARACVASTRTAAVGRLKKNKAKRAARKREKTRAKSGSAAERDVGAAATAGVEMGVMA